MRIIFYTKLTFDIRDSHLKCSVIASTIYKGLLGSSKGLSIGTTPPTSRFIMIQPRHTNCGGIAAYNVTNIISY